MIGNAIDRLLLAVSFRNLLNSAKRCRSEHSGFIHSRVLNLFPADKIHAEPFPAPRRLRHAEQT
jgi:hypothetical protein